MKLIGLLLIALLSPLAQSAKILITFPFPGRSQYIFMEQYIKTLAQRGHEVTVISPFENMQPVPNMRFIAAPKIKTIFDDIIDEISAASAWQLPMLYAKTVSTVSECVLEDANVQQLLHSGETFDLVLAELVQTEALFAFGAHFNATLVGFSSQGNEPHIDQLMGNISPVSYNPMLTSPRTSRMNYAERLANHFDNWLARAMHWFVVKPQMRRQYERYYPTHKMPLEQAIDSFALVLLGQHFSVSHVRPYLPNMIEVGGVHIANKSQPLPAAMQQFIEGAGAAGVIYFSLGSNVKSKDLPAHTRATLLQVFGRLKQRVLWKFEDEQLPAKPPNVYIAAWFPQADVLAHPNVKLFITHGGLLSTMESIYYGKPVLGLPVFYDQFMNIKRASRLGYGLGLDLQQLQPQQLQQTIETLLHTRSYAQTAAQMSERYRDQPETALERAIWWTEHVMRHKGAPHLRAESRNLNWLQLHSLDTLAVLLAAPLLLLYALIRLSAGLLRLVLRRGGSKQRADKRKKH
ncbi:Ugt35a [Drosophila busckii]|uniref:UDP-glucuronosyltransferase n=1 Tax=Drosophila busckii TaxID=30019 RepID=A0A0M4F2J3_DROBS|nr:UDP-glucuronosyltransferase 2B13 [Drosophila busckii]ALC45675.1 Ugt35a [Drosophila busckii]